MRCNPHYKSVSPSTCSPITVEQPYGGPLSPRLLEYLNSRVPSISSLLVYVVWNFHDLRFASKQHFINFTNILFWGFHTELVGWEGCSVSLTSYSLCKTKRTKELAVYFRGFTFLEFTLMGRRNGKLETKRNTLVAYVIIRAIKANMKEKIKAGLSWISYCLYKSNVRIFVCGMVILVDYFASRI